jgi:amino acid transporter
LLDILDKNCDSYDKEHASNLKKNTQGFVTTIAVYVFIIIVMGAACLFLYFFESRRLVRLVTFSVTITIMIIFTITFLGLVASSNKNLDSLEHSLECNEELVKTAVASVRTNVRAVAITASLSFIFSLFILFAFIYNNSSYVQSSIDSTEHISMGDLESGLKTTGVHV